MGQGSTRCGQPWITVGGASIKGKNGRLGNAGISTLNVGMGREGMHSGMERDYGSGASGSTCASVWKAAVLAELARATKPIEGARGDFQRIAPGAVERKQCYLETRVNFSCRQGQMSSSVK